MSLRLSLDGFDFFGDCLPAADESLPDPATMHQEGQGSGTDDDSSNDPLGLKPGNDIRGSKSHACSCTRFLTSLLLVQSSVFVTLIWRGPLSPPLWFA